jgi:hypothetical protein
MYTYPRDGCRHALPSIDPYPNTGIAPTSEQLANALGLKEEIQYELLVTGTAKIFKGQGDYDTAVMLYRLVLISNLQKAVRPSSFALAFLAPSPFLPPPLLSLRLTCNSHRVYARPVHLQRNDLFNTMEYHSPVFNEFCSQHLPALVKAYHALPKPGASFPGPAQMAEVTSRIAPEVRRIYTFWFLSSLYTSYGWYWLRSYGDVKGFFQSEVKMLQLTDAKELNVSYPSCSSLSSSFLAAVAEARSRLTPSGRWDPLRLEARSSPSPLDLRLRPSLAARRRQGNHPS